MTHLMSIAILFVLTVVITITQSRVNAQFDEQYDWRNQASLDADLRIPSTKLKGQIVIQPRFIEILSVLKRKVDDKLLLDILVKVYLAKLIARNNGADQSELEAERKRIADEEAEKKRDSDAAKKAAEDAAQRAAAKKAAEDAAQRDADDEAQRAADAAAQRAADAAAQRAADAAAQRAADAAAQRAVDAAAKKAAEAAAQRAAEAAAKKAADDAAKEAEDAIAQRRKKIPLSMQCAYRRELAINEYKGRQDDFGSIGEEAKWIPDCQEGEDEVYFKPKQMQIFGGRKEFWCVTPIRGNSVTRNSYATAAEAPC